MTVLVLEADITESVLESLRNYWKTEECQENLYTNALCTDPALKSAKQIVDTPIIMNMKLRKRILMAMGVLARCADRQFYHEHWFELGALLDAAAAAVPRAAEMDPALLSAAVYNLSTKMRHGEACEDVMLAANYLKRATRDGSTELLDDFYSQDDIPHMEEKVLDALAWDLPKCSSFSTLSILFARLAVFTKRSLGELDAAWEVAVQLLQDLALAGRFDFQVSLGAFLLALLKKEFLTIDDILTVHDHEVIVLASATDALGAASARPRYTECVKQAALSSTKDLHAALLGTLRELVTK
jgi:hypothetical protein